MKTFFSSHKLFILGFIILAVTNLIILTCVAFNKKGTKDSIITLTERELTLPYRTNRENSGVTLQISWRSLGKENYNIYSGKKYPLWLNEKKLKELGFNINMDSHKKPLSKEVFVVLEYNGDSYQKALKNSKIKVEEMKKSYDLDKRNREIKRKFERAKKQLNREQISMSRLFAIDAGVDPEKLRKKYNDSAQFMIARAQIKPLFSYDRDKKEVKGYIQRLSMGNIHVPLKYGRILKTITNNKKSNTSDIILPRYRINLAHGSRLEPWIVSVQPLNNNKINWVSG